MPLMLYNTIERAMRPFTPTDPSRVTFYSCGPTVYDDAHIGNFRSFLAADVLRRWLESPMCVVTDDSGAEHAGPREVVHVMNITDVGHMTDDAHADGGGEDKMEAAARRILEDKKSGKLPPDAKIDPGDPSAIADFYAGRFLEDARRLGLKVAIEAERDPTLMPRPTQKVPGMIALIERLIERGHAYAVGEPQRQTVYFDVRSFPEYGRLSGNTLDALLSGAGGRVDERNQQEKRHPADFMLWKADPSHVMKWPSPWGEGYPGWHLECSVMAMERLGETVDLHSGGEDNIFPHHECEIAQSRCASGRPAFSRMWFHVRFLNVDGEKMSKSKGTFFTPRDLFAKGHEAGAVRLELIRTHYRTNANFSENGLRDSARMLDRWRRFLEAAEAGPAGEADAAAQHAFADAMHDDLNIAGAIGAINKWVGEKSAPTRADAAMLRSFDAVLGVLERDRAAEVQTSIGVFTGGAEPAAEVEALLAERAEARKAKDFARSDAIRDELAARGYAIKDMAGGKVEVRPA